MGAALAIVAGGTVAAAASGLFTLPGGTEVTSLGATRSVTAVGTGSLDLGHRPEGATGVALSFTCLTPGTFTFDDGAGVACTTMDDTAHATTYVVPLDAIDGEEVTVTSAPEAAWTLTAGYVNAQQTDWETNQSGETFGVINGDGEPDLIAVIATNGRPGYVRRADLEEANGTTVAKSFGSPQDALQWQEQNAGRVAHISVYESDGKTLIGEFRVG
jgi:hypothetical protein